MEQRRQDQITVIPSLKEVYADRFAIGAAVSPQTIVTQKELLAAHYGSLTAENEMKPVSVQPEEGRFTFEDADRIARFAEEHGMQMRGHTLAWHNQTPDWMFVDGQGQPAGRDLVLQRMKDHIGAVVGRYKDRIKVWDVVNEAVSDEGPQLLRPSKWLETAGEEFIRRAFEYAHEADRDALLFYNDYNECHPDKRDRIHRLLKSLKEQGTPVHGMGMQGHWSLQRPSADEIRAAVELYASLDLQLHITELDVSVFEWDDKRTDLLEPTAEMLEAQERRYEEIFGLLREYSGVITSVTFWGAADDYTWLDHFPVRSRKNWPFLFDRNHQPKGSFWKVARL
ncbi:XynB [Paenibacillus mucilaginosus 3016]|uniref:Beta-xylanase n=1 Tax=Paenibacillus mucilaginosus 3016 TaxID=1116391 RepID=H6NCA2_9BACL|nr:endo-1,4-beta-xylanase [Paenibacillus mucilaginosus]AFC28295.1 XynB [Paenibacillus mucilaginosus 3016]WFA17102.1 endo-1,4-beta-xylanase [Paenibacillus mucilaginosus]